jgi:acylphosphatase
MKHLEVSIYGRVQGVSFRFNVKRKAEELGLSGWVKNMSNGSVYMEVEGDKDDLLDILNWCHKGPLFAKVERVDYEFSSRLKGFKNFKINY